MHSNTPSILNMGGMFGNPHEFEVSENKNNMFFGQENN
jgi:hypothetical protein